MRKIEAPAPPIKKVTTKTTTPSSTTKKGETKP